MIANGTLRTMEDDEDIYISLTQICEYFVLSANKIQDEIEQDAESNTQYTSGLKDMMFMIANEFVELGKFETQRRLINTPEDLLKLSTKQ